MGGAAGEETARWAWAMPPLCHGPLATSTCPSELGECFPSGVTMVPGQPELLCSTWPPPLGPQPGPGLGEGENQCGQSRGAPGSRQEGRAGSRDIPGWRPQWEWVQWLPQGGGSGGVGWGGGCLRQEGQMGQGRVEVKGGGREPILGGSQGGGLWRGEQICVCTYVSVCVYVHGHKCISAFG